MQRLQKCIEVLVILWKNNYAALKITDVGIFLFYFIQTSSPIHFLFKWRQNLSACRCICSQTPKNMAMYEHVPVYRAFPTVH